MRQPPPAPRTEAWKPSGVRSRRMVVAGLSMPRPAYVLMSGCLAARPGSMIGDS